MGIKEVVEEIMQFLQEKLRKELADQGHKHTGKLINSITFEVEEKRGGVTGLIWMETYGEYVETGVPASKIPFTLGSGRKTSKYIKALIDYFTKKGLPTREAKGAAFGTAIKHKREGMPTRASKRFSKTGKRTGFITETIKNNETYIETTIQQKTAEVYQIRFEQKFLKLAA